ncbi:hypothetical protein SELMODRAFT_447042 [Selaginella moellendorffii]|uniref:Uncharacterized protein n=1 Tax=Selaginella moellendorffii TaxID=88036 RepID=D8SW90_SELML|nr:uncharacterized protein LOC9629800 isoform X1 [Selaginella moellendorffii]EFJ11446.1 hypothetical protein SELMODRAFT_447042 [Selaginella moellendorffii]|eukprot:XP_002987610.1 uncharacterized protein LOC9629800 isoform X1 [Selaginella moellendorffii]
MPMALRFTLFLAVACTMAMFMASARPANIGEEVYDITRQNEVAGFAEDHPVNTEDDHGDPALTLKSCAGKGHSCAPFYVPEGVQCCAGLHCVAVIFGVGGFCA